jgi:glycosyltransferase involved in cell wall biosynthesis
MKSIIIPTYNHLEDCLKPCCESIIKYSDLTDVEIIIVANGCKDGTKEYVESLGEPFKLVWFDEGLGYTKATNEGVKVATGEIIILMNNDVVLLDQPKNQWLDFLVNPLKDNIGITCNLKIWDESVERMFAVGFLMATTRRIWDEIGGLDEAWSPGGGEDIEFCIKVEQLGYKIIQVPDENNKVINGINVNRFMSYHQGEATVMDDEHKEMWIKHIADVRKRLEHKYKLPEGWFYGGDVAEYRRLIEDIPMNGMIIELGCFKGRSICSVADIIKRKNLKVVVVDTFEGTVKERKEGEPAMDFIEEFRYNINRFELKEYITIYRGKTDDIYKELKDNIFDLLFLDADHSYEAVKQDLENWECKVKKGGTISGHDYVNWEGVGRAVNERYFNVRVNDEHFGIDSGIATGSVWSKRL